MGCSVEPCLMSTFLTLWHGSRWLRAANLCLPLPPPHPHALCSHLQESMAAEAADLASASFGDRMLGAIGGVYRAQADIFLGGVLDGSLAALR